jgi:hypothetical protein
LACTDPMKMLDFVLSKASARKQQLLCSAFWRRSWLWISEEERAWREAHERFIEGQLSDEEASRLFAGGDYFVDEDSSLPEFLQDLMVELPWGAIDRNPQYQPDPDENAVLDAERSAQSALIRDLFGDRFHPVLVDPAWLSWSHGTIPNLAQAIYDERAFDRLPLLADALEDAGGTDAAILSHCRQPGEHVRGCWVVDLLLGKS